jgi:hypothetical protein
MTILVSIIGILAVILVTSLLVIIIASQGRRDNRNKIFNAFSNAIDEFDLSIVRRDVLGKSMIAVDGQKEVLLYLTPNSDYYDAFFVHLCEIDSYEVVNEHSVDFNNYSRNEVAQTEVDRVKLRLNYKNGSKPLDLLFYNKNMDERSDFVLRSHLAEEWRNNLSSFPVSYGKLRDIQTMPNYKMYRNAA